MFVTNLWYILDGDDDRRLVVPSSGPLDPTDRVRHKVREFVHIHLLKYVARMCTLYPG